MLSILHRIFVFGGYIGDNVNFNCRITQSSSRVGSGLVGKMLFFCGSDGVHYKTNYIFGVGNFRIHHSWLLAKHMKRSIAYSFTSNKRHLLAGIYERRSRVVRCSLCVWQTNQSYARNLAIANRSRVSCAPQSNNSTEMTFKGHSRSSEEVTIR